MGILGSMKRRVTDANSKAKADMAKVRDDYRASASEHRAQMDDIKTRKDHTEGQ